MLTLTERLTETRREYFELGKRSSVLSVSNGPGFHESSTATCATSPQSITNRSVDRKIKTNSAINDSSLIAVRLSKIVGYRVIILP